jgi:FlaA1/EpsC-like NDP-sugar epimerase
MKIFYYEFIGSKKDRTNVVIYGDDQFAMMTQQVIEKDLNQSLSVVAFFGRRNGNKLDNIPIYKLDKLDKILKKHDVGQLIIARANISSAIKTQIFETCLNSNVKVLRVPDPSTWINGELSFRQLRKIQIEELLERDEIQLDEQKIKQQITNKIILVTGAAGSIGSEIVRQLTQYHPAKLILVDQAESPMYDLELELIEKLKFFDFKIFVADITNKEQMHRIYDLFRPSIVYHAAAYKHVPMMENNPEEAVRNNIFGTKIIADLANTFEVNKFVMVSTDKAVNPTNIMGATKRVAEIYIQSLNTNSKTSFITTRFGNVLGSNGSVIPRFKQQIEEGGPLTITHPDITRYFMTIPEACQLVLEAGAIGVGREIFLFDMGSPVKIVDLAKKMIKLSGLTLGKDIELKFSGLRPGEKLYEELLAVQENTLPTHHPKILKAKVREYNYGDISLMLNELSAILKTHNYFEIVKKIKHIVPEFISKNSKYEVLDINTGKKVSQQNKI